MHTLPHLIENGRSTQSNVHHSIGNPMCCSARLQKRSELLACILYRARPHFPNIQESHQYFSIIYIRKSWIASAHDSVLSSIHNVEIWCFKGLLFIICSKVRFDDCHHNLGGLKYITYSDYMLQLSYIYLYACLFITIFLYISYYT